MHHDEIKAKLSVLWKLLITCHECSEAVILRETKDLFKCRILYFTQDDSFILVNCGTAAAWDF